MYTKALFTLIILSISGFALNKTTNNKRFYEKDNEQYILQHDFDQGYELENNIKQDGYNTPGRIAVENSWDVFTEASFIYWNTKETGLDIAYKKSKTVDYYNSNFIKMNFDYHPGFQLGLGLKLDHDDWEFFSQYTWLHFNDNFNADSDSHFYLIPLWIKDVSQTSEYAASHVTGHWNFKISLWDFLEIGRSFYVGKALIVKPFIGGRSFWLNQKFNASYVIDSVNKISHNSSESWAIGPKIGVNSKWLLGYNFRLFANLDIALTYQRFKAKTTQSNPIEDSFIEIASKSYGLLTPQLTIKPGIGWGSYFNNNASHIDFSLSCDFSHFWYQNAMRNLKDASALLIDSNFGNLMFHGLTITMRFDF
jgi:hypothetical protein